jgi:hypothetical protein
MASASRGSTGRSGTPASRALDYSNLSALGEYVLGYPNEYAKFTDRPLVPADAASALLPDALDAPGQKDVGRNGSYLVFRQLGQDVRRFWQFVHGAAGGDLAAAERLAAVFVGRTRAGDPLVPLSARPVPGTPDEQAAQNHFTFDGDPRRGWVRSATISPPSNPPQHRLSGTARRTHEAARRLLARRRKVSRRLHLGGAVPSHPAPRPRHGPPLDSG